MDWRSSKNVTRCNDGDQHGFFHRIGDHVRDMFDFGRPDCAVDDFTARARGVAVPVAAELTKSTGSKGTISKAVGCNALGGVMRRQEP